MAFARFAKMATTLPSMLLFAVVKPPVVTKPFARWSKMAGKVSPMRVENGFITL